MNTNAFMASDEDYTFTEEEWEEYVFETRPDDFGNHHSSAWSEMPSDEVYCSESDEEEDQHNVDEYFAQQEEEPVEEDAEDDDNAEDDDHACFYEEYDHERTLRAGVARHSRKSLCGDCDW